MSSSPILISSTNKDQTPHYLSGSSALISVFHELLPPKQTLCKSCCTRIYEYNHWKSAQGVEWDMAKSRELILLMW